MSEHKTCESCGMPMRTIEDFGGNLSNNKYCVHCCDTEGNLMRYETVLENMKQFAVRTMGISDTEALKMAREGMAKHPAWKHIK